MTQARDLQPGDTLKSGSGWMKFIGWLEPYPEGHRSEGLWRFAALISDYGIADCVLAPDYEVVLEQPKIRNGRG